MIMVETFRSVIQFFTDLTIIFYSNKKSYLTYNPCGMGNALEVKCVSFNSVEILYFTNTFYAFRENDGSVSHT